MTSLSRAAAVPTIQPVDPDCLPIVEVTGAINGRYELLEQADDGTVVLGPDTSFKAIMERLGSRPATDEEFQQAFGELPTGPA